MMYDTALSFWKKTPRTKFEKVDKKISMLWRADWDIQNDKDWDKREIYYTYILLKQNKTVAWDVIISPKISLAISHSDRYSD